MAAHRSSLHFGHHALAVLGAALLCATGAALVWGVGLVTVLGDRLPGIAWLIVASALCWLAVFAIALPSAGIVFSLLWPITRRRSGAGRWICILAGATIGILLAPSASARYQTASWLQLNMSAIIGMLLAMVYLLLLDRLEARG